MNRSSLPYLVYLFLVVLLILGATSVNQAEQEDASQGEIRHESEKLHTNSII